MLRTACLKNFVKYRNYQCLDFHHNDGPSIFIGENGSGKSSVLEGIRRCLKPELSSSASSTPDPSRLSYFVCSFEKTGTKMENVICGIVVIPEESSHKNTDSEEDDDTEEQDFVPDLTNLFLDKEIGEQTEHKDAIPDNSAGIISESPTIVAQENTKTTADGRSSENTNERQTNGAVENSETDTKVESYYKFAMKYSNTTPEKLQPLHLNLVQVTSCPDGKSQVVVTRLKYIGDDFQLLQQKFIHAIIRQGRSLAERTSDKDVKNFLTVVFDKRKLRNIEKVEGHVEEINECQNMLETLSNEIVFTFPLRSIGPLQWSESERIRQDRREENYLEAEKRCEIIKCFLADIKYDGQRKFNKEKEEQIFKAITQMENDDYHFELTEEDRISLPNGNHTLLKVPEGVLEAKAFSILMSGKCYKTIVLEEPDRGMHPQFIDRLTQVIKQYKNEKRVILTTHNAAFITPWSLPNCFVSRHQDKEYCIISGREIIGAPTLDNIHMKKLRLLTSDHVSDILFAKKVLFFEGDSEMLFLTELKQQILRGELKDIDIFNESKKNYINYNQLKKNISGLTLVKMNGKGNAKFCHSICKKLKLEHLIIVDRDAVDKSNGNAKDKSDEDSGEESDEEAEETNKECAVQKKKDEKNKDSKDTNIPWPERRQKYLKEKGMFIWRDGDIESMVIEISKHGDGLLGHLDQENVTLKETPSKRLKSEKLFLRKGVTLLNIEKCVKLIAANCRVCDDLYQLIKCMERGDLYHP